MKTRDDLLAQLEAEQAAGDPQWGHAFDMFAQALHLLAATCFEVDHARRRSQKKAA